MDDTNNVLYLDSVENAAVIYVGAPLDRDVMTSGDTYTMWISVSDGTYSGEPTILKVKVTDVNDNPPVFEKEVYSFEVSEVCLSELFLL